MCFVGVFRLIRVVAIYVESLSINHGYGSVTMKKEASLSKYFKKVGLFGALMIGASSNLYAADWSDTFIGYRYSTKFAEPGIAGDIAKNIVQLNYVSGYKYGTNFFNVDYLRSDGKDPAAGGGSGAQEAYAVYRHNLSLSKVTGIPMKFGVIRDVGITAGFDLSAKNTAFAPSVRKFVVGPTLSFDVPGFFDVSLLYRTEHNHNGIVGAGVSFDPTYGVSAAWGIPFNMGIPVVFKGFGDYIGKKGKDGFGIETEPETLIQASLMFDVGSLAGLKKVVYVGPGYEYWNNKFGSSGIPGTRENAAMINAEVHF